MLKTLFKFVGGAVVGAAAGAAVGIFVAPASGEDFKQMIIDFKDEIIQAGQDAQEQRRIELQSRFAEAKKFDQTNASTSSLS